MLVGHLRLFTGLVVNFVRLIDVNSMKHNKVIGMSNDVCSGKWLKRRESSTTFWATQD